MGDVHVTAAQDGSTTAEVGRPVLTAMVIGSMVGAGVFSLPARFGTATGVVGALIAWAIAGTGMLMLAFCFQTLAVRKPELDAGVFVYAKAGFGDYVGFNSSSATATPCWRSAWPPSASGSFTRSSPAACATPP